MSGINSVYYPNVSKIPEKTGVDSRNPSTPSAREDSRVFGESLNQAIQQLENPAQETATTGLKFSSHAAQRLRERNITLSQETLGKINEAVTKAHSKGVQDTLVLTDKAAMIISVPSRTVITAMDRNNLLGNVFTNIDGAVII